MYICDVMNTKKYTYLDGDFHYEDSKTYMLHGLLNYGRNKFIGYRYRDQRKGFWLRNYKD